jgi:hypothetical protein
MMTRKDFAFFAQLISKMADRKDATAWAFRCANYFEDRRPKVKGFNRKLFMQLCGFDASNKFVF